MPLTLSRPTTPVTIGPPIHVMASDQDPNWRRVEAVASRFGLPSQRVAVRVYLYSVLRDVEALRRYGDHLLYRRKLRNAVRRGRRLLEEARKADPDLMASVLADLMPITATDTAARPGPTPRS